MRTIIRTGLLAGLVLALASATAGAQTIITKKERCPVHDDAGPPQVRLLRVSPGTPVNAPECTCRDKPAVQETPAPRTPRVTPRVTPRPRQVSPEGLRVRPRPVQDALRDPGRLLGRKPEGRLRPALRPDLQATESDSQVGSVFGQNPGYYQISLTHLEVRIHSGDFEQWGQDRPFDTSAETLKLRWSTKENDAALGRWELSQQPFEAGEPPRPDGSLLLRGYSPLPDPGKMTWISLPASSFAPAQQPATTQRYYIRLIPLQGGPGSNPAGPASPQVTLRHTPPQDPTVFTVAGLYPELWVPMPIRVSLSNFHVVQADEEDDEEPYLLVAVIYADGTTIDISHPGTSTIRMDHTHQTHGNVPTPYGDLGSGDTVALGFDWERSILPVGLQFADLGAVSDTTLTSNTNVYILVVAMEEDALNTSAVTAGWSAACNVLQSELNQIAQTLDLATALNGGPDIDMAALQKKVQDAAEKTTKAKIMTGDIFPLDDAVDPDDFVGWGIYRISYETLRNSKSFYNPYYHTKLWYGHQFTMDLHNTDSGVHYQVSGQVIRTD